MVAHPHRAIGQHGKEVEVERGVRSRVNVPSIVATLTSRAVTLDVGRKATRLPGLSQRIDQLQHHSRVRLRHLQQRAEVAVGIVGGAQ